MAARARILAIDDQHYFRSFLEGLLSEEGYEVVAAAPGAASAEALAEWGPFDLVVMDVVGGGGSPGDAVASVRTRAPDPAIVVLTSVDDVRAAVSTFQSGACDYLLKPVDRGALLAAIHRGLQTRKASHAGTPQLLDENMAFMARLSLLERAVPLLVEEDLHRLTDGLLELCCVEACGTEGVLWLRTDPGEPLRTAAHFGEGVAAEIGEPWTRSDVVDRTLAAGMALITHDPKAPRTASPSLFVPFFANGVMLAIARVSARVDGDFTEPDAQASLEVGELGGMALGSAIERVRAEEDRLHEPATGLSSLVFYHEILRTEVQRAHRFGRRLCCLCVDVRFTPPSDEAVQAVVRSLAATLRTTDVLCAQSTERYWILVTETDPLGGVVLKRRLADGLRATTPGQEGKIQTSLGVASYPLDGESLEALMECAAGRARVDRESVIHDLGFESNEPLARIGERLLARAFSLPAGVLGDVAEFLIGELTTRPHDSGLLFLAPGGDPGPIMGPLMAMGDAETATEVFLATDGDTVPACSALTAVALPPNFSSDTTWMLRFGEGPPYALLAGPAQDDGTRLVYHTTDPVLVEHMTFRLCAEVGVGVRS